MSLLERIQALCSRKNTTFVGLEREIGLGRGTIRNWEKSSPSTDKLQKVADYFKVSTDYLVYGFNRQWLAAALKLIMGERPLTQFAELANIDVDELHELCTGTARKQPSLNTIEKINANKFSTIPPRREVLEAAGYDPDEYTAYPLLHIRIKELREKANLTIEELSEKAEIDSSIVYLYEAGEKDNDPDPFVLAQIADVFDCTPDYILGLANKSIRARYNGFMNSKYSEIINQIDEFIKNIGPDKYRKQQHNKMMDEINAHREENKQPLPPLSPKDEREIAKDLESMLGSLDSKNGMAAYNDPEDEEDRELLKASLLTSMRLAKQIAKKKFTPKKYRKE